MDTKAKTATKQLFPDQYFGLCVFSFDRRHVPAAGGTIMNVRHNEAIEYFRSERDVEECEVS